MIYNFLYYFPIPFILGIIDSVLNYKIKLHFCFNDCKKLESATHILLYKKNENSVEILPLNSELLLVGNQKKKSTKQVISFQLNKQRFVFNEKKKSFISLQNSFINDNLEEFVNNYRYGIKEKYIPLMRKTWGKNEMHFKIRNWKEIFADQFFEPANLFGIFCLIIFYIGCEIYTYISLYYYITDTIGGILSELEVQNHILQTASNSASVVVLRENSDKTFTKKIVPTKELLPGDLIEIIANMPVPADCVLIHGECVAQESVLTGESTPILKVAYVLENEDKQKNLQIRERVVEKNLLHCGTQIIYTKGSMRDSMLAVVVGTGFYTRKGKMLQMNSSGSNKKFRLYEDSVDFMQGFIICGGICTIIYFVWKMISVKTENEFSSYGIFLDLISIWCCFIKPTLPYAVFAGIGYALERLGRAKVVVMNSLNLTEAAWLSTICFDKTGTLTEDDMKMQGFMSTKKVIQNEEINKRITLYNKDVQQMKDENEEQEQEHAHANTTQIVSVFEPMNKSMTSKVINTANPLLLECFGLCNSIMKIGKKIVGDPVEIEMFKNSIFDFEFLPKFQLIFKEEQESNSFKKNREMLRFFIPNNEGKIVLGNFLYRQVQTYDFDNKRKRMSTISSKYPRSEKILAEIEDQQFSMIHNLEDLDSLFVTTKGAPEAIHSLCKPETLPDDYKEVNNLMSSQGFKVLAMAGKTIPLNIFKGSSFDKTEEGSDKITMENKFDNDNIAELETLMTRRDNQIKELIADTDSTEVEKDMDFLGFYILENPLKNNAEKVIHILKDKNINSKIITGDNLFTALNVGKRVSIVPNYAPTFVGEVDYSMATPAVVWKSMDSFFSKENQDERCFSIDDIRERYIMELEGINIYEEDSQAKKANDSQASSELTISNLDDMNNAKALIDEVKDEQKEQSINFNFNEEEGELNNFDIGLNSDKEKGSVMIVSGEVFDVFIQQTIGLKDLSVINDFDAFKKIVKGKRIDGKVKANLTCFAQLSKVFGRCNSDQKTRIINFLKMFKLYENTTLGFVGDGSNDLQAIKAADTSLKLGFSDLSKSTSFVSEDNDLSDVLLLIQEAKTALVNGFHNFSIIMVISFYQTLITFISFGVGAGMNEIELITTDFFISAFILANIPAMKPQPRISPLVPQNSIYTKEILINFIGNIILISFLVLYGYYLMGFTDYYISPDDIKGGNSSINLKFEGSEKFFDSHYIFFLHLIVVLVYGAVDNIADHFRQNFFSSKSITIKYMLLLGFTMLIGILPFIDIRNNPFFYILVYIYRVRLIYSNENYILVIMYTFGIGLAYIFGCIFIKMISVLSVYNENKEGKYKEKYEKDLLKILYY
jgi:cation-transporting ATPase 13A3/4/5